MSRHQMMLNHQETMILAVGKVDSNKQTCSSNTMMPDTKDEAQSFRVHPPGESNRVFHHHDRRLGPLGYHNSHLGRTQA